MANARATKSKQDVCYLLDAMDCVCVDLYAKALNILDGNNPDCWDYDMFEKRKMCVSHASLVGGNRLEVKGELGQWCNLTPNTLYCVYFDFKLQHNAKGFNHNPITFEFIDQNRTIKRFSQELVHGETRMLIGKFIWDPNSPHNVTAKMYNFNGQEKSGLLVRRMRVTHGDGRDEKECLASNEEKANGFWASFIKHYGRNINQFNTS